MTKLSVVLQESWPSIGREHVTSGRISPSTLVMGCLRRCYYDLIGQKPVKAEGREVEALMIMDVGSFLHQQIQEGFKKWYEAHGWTYLPESGVTLSDNCKGTCDAFLVSPEGEPLAHEYKTCSRGVFEKIGKTPNQANVRQFMLYMSKLSVKVGSLFYICRDNMKQREFPIKYNQKMVDELMEKIRFIEEAAVNRIPPDPTTYWMGTSPCIRSCPFRNVCPAARTPSRKLK